MLLWGATACTMVQRLLPVSESPAEEGQRAALALADLEELREVDALIRLDNDLLLAQIESALDAQAAQSPAFAFKRLRARAARQLIRLDATLVMPGAEETIEAELQGDVLLSVSGGYLVWLPRFNSIELANAPVEDASGPDATAQAPDASGLLERVNKEIADAVIVLGKNTVRIDAMPLGALEVGAELLDLQGVSARGQHPLGGVFTVAGSVIKIEPSVTSIALDLEFIPNISTCPADVFVSRSTFASEIRNREPIGITRILDDSDSERHFFTEISGATRSTAVVHYWFADGVPVWLEELPVEPSYRWRTWSSKRIEPDVARNWEVVVVEKQTGCILHSQAIRVDHVVSPDGEVATPNPGAYDTFSIAFDERMAGFGIRDEKPEIALIQVRRAFLNQALHTSVKDIQVVVNFDADALPTQRMAGTLEAFDTNGIVCEERSCSASRSCPGDFAQCIRDRDARDCTRCLFRNPLNNRCVTEGVDPICEAAKTSQNAKFDAAYDACLEQAAAEKTACERLLAQELQSCELEAASEQTACEAGKAAVERLAGASAIADVDLKLHAGGGLSAIFSDFQVEGDLERLRMNLVLSGALDLEGSIRFAPYSSLGPLGACINAWQKSFTGRVVLPYEAHTMIAPIALSSPELRSSWSGYAVPASINPPPLEAMFVENPSLLADCHIGLTVDRVAREISGPASAYLQGQYRLEVQPAATRIRLGEASVSFGDRTLTADPVLSGSHLTYRVEEE
ncbi:MAG: DUF2914 domain-containing protein [Xanthomonadales bacterium]|nr:DUF2914 domain-containing protein [Xanthomonadales bacterium]